MELDIGAWIPPECVVVNCRTEKVMRSVVLLQIPASAMGITLLKTPRRTPRTRLCKHLGGLHMEAGIFTEAGTLIRIASRITSVYSVCRTTSFIVAMTMGIGWNVTAPTRTAAGGAS